MSDRSDTTGLTDEAVGAALRELPLVAPASPVWTQLEQSLRAQGLVREAQPRRRDWRIAAIAAGLAAVAVTFLVLRPTPPATPVVATAAPVAGATEIDQLRRDSQRLETWLRDVASQGAPLDGADLMAATEIEDLIALVDLQLAGGNESSTETAALWRQRVELLRDLAVVRTSYSLADNRVAANGAAATPSSWNTERGLQ
ncbi:hypothetical protein [Tahibacter amnicola]|uniref:Uncharacterized protein n=1 Tax=Tahibacter amnicola TaxID=2976241 RepID=A0ABY6BEQ0_9GAMM|nr:hypothetical protein [Tahibacter amnicola]UXI67580.1 hypothetical protein N4264_23035 [Tahibacter amnicola]